MLCSTAQLRSTEPKLQEAPDLGTPLCYKGPMSMLVPNGVWHRQVPLLVTYVHGHIFLGLLAYICLNNTHRCNLWRFTWSSTVFCACPWSRLTQTWRPSYLPGVWWAIPTMLQECSGAGSEVQKDSRDYEQQWWCQERMAWILWKLPHNQVLTLPLHGWWSCWTCKETTEVGWKLLSLSQQQQPPLCDMGQDWQRTFFSWHHWGSEIPERYI